MTLYSLLLLFCIISTVSARCDFPSYLRGRWSAVSVDVGLRLDIKNSELERNHERQGISQLSCHTSNATDTEGQYALYSLQYNCYRCMQFRRRSQYEFWMKLSSCQQVSNPDLEQLCEANSDRTEISMSKCYIPPQFHGSWFGLDRDGKDMTMEIKSNNARMDGIFDGFCDLALSRNATTNVAQSESVSTNVTLKDVNQNCYICMNLILRTPNVFQYRRSNCITMPKGPHRLEQVCEGDQGIKPGVTAFTMFQLKPQDSNCKATFEGEYAFDYEMREKGGGWCNSPQSAIIACQAPGSQYVDNQVFDMSFGPCPGVGSTLDERNVVSFQYQCLGMWYDAKGNMFAAIMDKLQSKKPRDKYRCLLTTKDQTEVGNRKRWGMSDKAQCRDLTGTYESPVRLILKARLPQKTNIPLKPTCNMPLNYTGQWFTTNEYDAAVTINQTHMNFVVKMGEYSLRETVYVCQQHKDSRFLMMAVTSGRCDIDFVCVDFSRRRQNVIRYRTSKSYRLPRGQKGQSVDLTSSWLEKMFRRSCLWLSFGLDHESAQYWKYGTLILDPPTPVKCPIAGRFSFTQKGEPNNLYRTRIRGMTQRPRVWQDCREWSSIFYSCKDQKRLSIDQQQCETLDDRGKPIWEYEWSDWDLTCVGYWMEDAKSYLITYDKEDTVSPYRCWVYRRLGWRRIRMSRAVRSACGVTQQPASSESVDGASLALELEERERIHDECPMRYDDGSTMLGADLEILVLGRSSVRVYNSVLIASGTLLTFLLRLALHNS